MVDEIKCPNLTPITRNAQVKEERKYENAYAPDGVVTKYPGMNRNAISFTYDYKSKDVFNNQFGYDEKKVVPEGFYKPAPKTSFWDFGKNKEQVPSLGDLVGAQSDGKLGACIEKQYYTDADGNKTGTVNDATLVKGKDGKYYPSFTVTGQASDTANPLDKIEKRKFTFGPPPQK